MKHKPQIAGPECHDFHDGLLLRWEADGNLHRLIATIALPKNKEEDVTCWRVTFNDVLSLKVESSLGPQTQSRPADAYDIYSITSGEEIDRWRTALSDSGCSQSQKNSIVKVVIASMDFYGLGGIQSSGIEIICCGWSIDSVLEFDKDIEGWSYQIPASD